MADLITQPPEALFVVTLRYDIPEYHLDVPADGVGFLHHSGVKVLIGYRPDGTPSVLTETNHEDQAALELILADRPGTEASDDDPRLTAFMEEVRTRHRLAAHAISTNLRWLLARPGGHRAVGRRQSARFRVAGETEWRTLLMRRLAPLTGVAGKVELDEAWRGAIQEATRLEWEEPLAHEILREAKQQIDPNPRSALVLTMTAEPPWLWWRLQQLEEHGVMADRNTSSNGASTQRRYPSELRERAIRMVQETFDRGDQRQGVVTRIARQLGIGPESLRKWVHQAEVDRGQRPGISSEDARRIAELERENRELRRANEILKSASAFFAAELDRPQRR